MKIGYIKQTTKEEIELQSALLTEAGCLKIYVEPVNNINYKSREKLFEAIDYINSGDILAVIRLSALSQSVQHLLEVLYNLEEKKVILEAIEQQYSSKESYSMDELLFYISEFIEDLRKEKQAYGISKAKAKGKKLGRPSKMSIKKVQKAIYLKKFHTSQQVANRFGVGTSTLLRHISKYKLQNMGKTVKAG